MACIWERTELQGRARRAVRPGGAATPSLEHVEIIDLLAQGARHQEAGARQTGPPVTDTLAVCRRSSLDELADLTVTTPRVLVF